MRKFAWGPRAEVLRTQVGLLAGCRNGAVPVCDTAEWPGGFSYDMPYMDGALTALSALRSGLTDPSALIGQVVVAARNFPLLPGLPASQYLTWAIQRGREMDRSVWSRVRSLAARAGTSWTSALDFGETCGTHGDLSVDNILVNPDGTVVLIDPVASLAPRRATLDAGKLVASALVRAHLSDGQDTAALLVRHVQAGCSEPEWVSVQAHAALHVCRMVPYVHALPWGRTALAESLSGLLTDLEVAVS